MQKLLGQLMNCCIDVDSSEEEDYEQVSRNRVRCSMTSLISWYESATKVRSLCVTSLQKRLTFIFFKRRKLNTSNLYAVVKKCRRSASCLMLRNS